MGRIGSPQPDATQAQAELVLYALNGSPPKRLALPKAAYEEVARNHAATAASTPAYFTSAAARNPKGPPKPPCMAARLKRVSSC